MYRVTNGTRVKLVKNAEAFCVNQEGEIVRFSLENKANSWIVVDGSEENIYPATAPDEFCNVLLMNSIDFSLIFTDFTECEAWIDEEKEAEKFVRNAISRWRERNYERAYSINSFTNSHGKNSIRLTFYLRSNGLFDVTTDSWVKMKQILEDKQFITQ